MKRAIIPASVAATLLLASVAALAVAEHVEIRVRLLNGRSGKPYAGRSVQLFGDKAKTGLLKSYNILFHLQTKTGPDGVAHFQIGPPLPYRLSLALAQNGGCAWRGAPPIITEEVLRSGFVGPNLCASENQSFHWQEVKPEPGEIILFVTEPPWP
jgi:hypothetical protein